MVQFCVHCGTQLCDEGVFCHACGKAKVGTASGLNDTAAQPAHAPVTTITEPDALATVVRPPQSTPAERMTNGVLPTRFKVFAIVNGAYGLLFLVLFVSALNAQTYVVGARLGLQGLLMVATTITMLRSHKEALALFKSSAALYGVCSLFGAYGTVGFVATGLLLLCWYDYDAWLKRKKKSNTELKPPFDAANT